MELVRTWEMQIYQLKELWETQKCGKYQITQQETY